jgi:predicted metal-dependent enzyme (double-stranded beta helix superfamily)
VSLTLEQLERFAVDLACRPERWRRHVRHRDDVRVYEEIHADHEVNAWVICWSSGQDTGFHDHDESAAGIAVVEGRIREERLNLAAAPSAREYGAGATLTVPPTAIHRVLHAGVGPAVTIHAYSPPLQRTGAYRVGARGELQREAVPIEAELTPAGRS